MKKAILLLIGIISLLYCTSCEEKDAKLSLSAENISNPENVRMDYTSPDPHCIPMRYEVTANSCASEISIKCTNANSILIENHNGKTVEDYSYYRGHWTAKIVNSNTITITFSEIDATHADKSGCVRDEFNVVSLTPDGKLSACVAIVRFTDSTAPIIYY